MSFQFRPERCDWATYTQAKSGQHARHFCHTCGLFAKRRECPFDKARSAAHSLRQAVERKG